MNTRPVLAITPGEPAGIGPEILLRFCADHPGFRVLAVADPVLLRQTAEYLGLALPIHDWRPGDSVEPGRLSCHALSLAEPSTPGELNPSCLSADSEPRATRTI